MAESAIRYRQAGFLKTVRTDNWWLEPVLVLTGLTLFAIYSSWAAFQGAHYWYSAGTEGFGGYLSPFYSPLIYIDTASAGSAPLWHAWLGSWPSWWPSFLPKSPSFFILIFPLLFRFTCYYYRGAYYKAFAGTPPACAVGPVNQKDYKGETSLLIFQNLHRYAMYIAVLYIFILSYDAVLAFFIDGKFGIGVGSLILLLNPVFLGIYTFGCHSIRHMVGGKSDCFSCTGGSLRHGVYNKVSWMNRHHKLFAWVSLVWVGFCDFYIRMVSSGVFTDFNTWGV